jgi:hypothetical protein
MYAKIGFSLRIGHTSHGNLNGKNDDFYHDVLGLLASKPTK